MSFFSGFGLLCVLTFTAIANPKITRWTFYSRAIPAIAILSQEIALIGRLGIILRALILLSLATLILVTLGRLVRSSKTNISPVT